MSRRWSQELGGRAGVGSGAGIGADAGGWVGRLARPAVLRLLSRMEEGFLEVQLPGGEWRRFGRPDAARRARAHIVRDDVFRRILLQGEIGVGEAYMAGDWWSEEPERVLEIGAMNLGRLDFGHPLSRLGAGLDALRHRWNANSRRGSRRNIRAHYDLGNEFYRLFLDPTWSYSSAWYESEDQPIAEAQAAKNRRILDKLGLRPHHHLLEIGCGWGGFALQAARETGCRVTGITLSREQHDLARRRVAESPVADRIDIRFLDYRDLDGSFDRIVSIEMFEAVGWEYYDDFFGACDRVLSPGGSMVMQAITVPDRGFHAYRRKSDWIRKYIFPGSLLASVAEIERSLARVGRRRPDGSPRLRLEARDEMGHHYPRTLESWRHEFHRHRNEARALGFDDTFLRMWDYYLASCIAGFRSGVIGNVQLTLRK